MTSRDRVIAICKERNLPISRLEADCGFSNGYIRSIKRGLPADRLFKIAEYLGVSPAYLNTGIEEESAAKPEETDDDLMELRQAMRERPEVAFLMKLAVNGKTSDVLEVAAILQRYKEASEKNDN